MNKRLLSIACALAAAVYLLMATIALADPPSPFNGSANAVPVAGFSVITISPTATALVVNGVGLFEARLSGQLGTVDSDIEANTINVTDPFSVLSATTTFFNTDLNTVSTVPEFLTSSQQITGVSGLLVNTGEISSSILSRSEAVRRAAGESSIASLTLFGDPEGDDPLVTAELITSSVDARTTSSSTAAIQTSAVLLQEPAIWLRLSGGITQVVTADLITSTASASCDSAGANDTDLDYGFQNLRVSGQPVNPTPGTAITVTDGAEDVARISFFSLISETSDASSALAGVLPLQIEVISDVGSLRDGSQFSIGFSSASCDIPEPTAVQLSEATATERGPGGTWLASLAVLALVSGVVLTRRRW